MATTTTVAVSAVATLSTAPVAQALPVPTPPDNASVASEWANPNIRPNDGVEGITIDVVDAPDTLAPNADFTARVAITNASETPLESFSITPRRGPISASVADSRVASVAEPTDYTAGETRNFNQIVAPGETVELEITVHTDPALAGSLPFPGPAVYPLMLELTRGGGGHLDSERFHLAVRSAGAADDGDQNTRDQEATVPAAQRSADVSLLYPITADADIVPGETGDAPNDPQLILNSEDLADQLTPGGRLSELVNTYADAIAAPGGENIAEATCLAIDPALVSTVERMSAGYVVAETRPPIAQEPKRLRDSWGDNDNAFVSTPGAGQADAQAWLNQLTEITKGNCVVALPWANADVNALVDAGAPWLVREALERGPFTLRDILGAEVVDNVVIPPSGYVSESTVPALGWADHENSGLLQGGMQAAWERSYAEQAKKDSATTHVEGEQLTNLELEVPPNPDMAVAPAPTSTVRVLVANNTVSRETLGNSDTDRFAQLGDGIVSVAYQDSLASTLASTGIAPETTGYSNVYYRSDATLDSVEARNINAANAIRLAVDEEAATSEEPSGNPVLINPPATWEASTADSIMNTIAELMDDEAARPMTLEDYLTPPADGTIPTANSSGSPFPDPTVFSDSEILSIGQQAKYADDLTSFLVPDSAIALTRYGFTLPLRRDLISAASLTYRRSADLYTEATAQTRDRLNSTRDSLNEMRDAVDLIPPGNVYTRASESSPLLIVAENGLPLPIDATILYEAPEGVTLNTPSELRIPARGSITIQLTADIPNSRERTDLNLYLATPNGQPVSQPVQISVRTAAGEVGAVAIGGVLAIFLALVLLFRFAKSRRAKDAEKSVSSKSAPEESSLDRPPD
ncbi:hypothetical protein [Corynebacterium lubricantis]|uniref:hypothetical protein n=1 Tax=Corynebacterium lubricantis TaxID=541095 RepID=UPI000399D429|nr:hypothetical protein [Corynebacterium lubricantis]